uniref:(northern house mosquito) hypothetical protein n=1 Tax=Culex pipiens TaxID=7175 RepID=A0A8D8DRB4_CULPI
MAEAARGGHRHPAVETDRVLARGAVPSGGKHVLAQDGLAAVRESDGARGAARQGQHYAVHGRVHRQAGLPEEDERLLAVALSADDYDSQHLPVSGPDVRAAESDRPLDLGHGAGVVPGSHSDEHARAGTYC